MRKPPKTTTVGPTAPLLPVLDVPRLAFVEDLTMEPLPAGSQLIVEYDPSSQWYNASITMAAQWLKTGGSVRYCTFTQPPGSVRPKFTRLGVDVEELEKSGKLEIYDLYSATLGRKPTGTAGADSLKAADWSIQFLQQRMPTSTATESDFQSWSKHLTIVDDNSSFARFNDEKAWVELELTRIIPSTRLRKMTYILSLMRAIHDEWVYRRLESAVDGVIDVKLDDMTDPARNLIRIRTMRNVRYDGKWHSLKVARNPEIVIEQ